MSSPTLKALVICDEIADSADGSGLMDLRGAGRTFIRTEGPFPIKRSFWVYLELTHDEPKGIVELAIMRADSERRHYFRSVPVEFPDVLESTQLAIRVFDCVFPAPGVYFIELWYNGEWMIDQRLVVEGGTDS